MDSPVAKSNVNVTCTCIADGLVSPPVTRVLKPGEAPHGSQTARLSIVLSPTASTQPGALIDLRTWPQFFEGGANGFALYVVNEAANPKTITLITKENGQPLLLRDTESPAKFNKAQDIWTEIFTSKNTCSADIMFDALKTASNQRRPLLSLTPPEQTSDNLSFKATLNAQGEGPGNGRGSRNFALEQTINYHYSGLGLLLTDLAVEELAYALGLRLVAAASRDVLSPPPPVRPGGSSAQAMSLFARAQRPLDPRVSLSYSTELWHALLGNSQPGDAYGLLYELAGQKLPNNSAVRSPDGSAENYATLQWLFPSGPHSIPPSAPSEIQRTVESLSPAKWRGDFFSSIAQGQTPLVAHILSPKTRVLSGLQRLVNRFDAAWTPQPPPDPDDIWYAGTPSNIVRRKLGAIMSFPTLAKFLCLIADVQVDAMVIAKAAHKDDANSNYYGSLIVVLVDQKNPAPLAKTIDLADVALVRTAFVLKEDRPGHFSSFVVGPADERFGFGDRTKSGSLTNQLNQTYPFTGGLVNLNLGRFRLETIDLAGAVNAGRVQGQALRTQKSNGTWPDSMSVKAPELRTRGISLLDIEIATQTMMDMALRPSFRPFSVDRPNPPSIDPPLCLNDLVIGYRLDVRRWITNDNGRNGNRNVAPGTDAGWRTLMAREVIFHDIYKTMFGVAPPADRFAKVKHPFGDRYIERDDGVIRQLLKTQTQSSSSSSAAASQDAGTTVLPITSHNVVTWSGNSLGLSALDKKSQTVTCYDPWRDLGIDVEYRYAVDKSRWPHVLRVGDGYEFGMRYVLPNGSSISLDEAKNQYTPPAKHDATPPTIGPYVFKRSEEIPAPNICLPVDDPTVFPPPDSPSQGDQSDLVILIQDTSSKNGRDHIRRFLVPPRAVFDYVEQYKLFDDIKTAQPAGALKNFDIVATKPPPKNKVAAGPAQKLPMRAVVAPNPPTSPSGLVLKYKPNVKRDEPYYADPVARNIGVTFIRNGGHAIGFEEYPPPFAFWQDQSPTGSRNAAPVELLFRRWEDADRGGRFGKVQKIVFKDGTQPTPEHVDQLPIDVAPAEDVEVIVWAYPDMATAFNTHKLFDMASRSINDVKLDTEDLWFADELSSALDGIKSIVAHLSWNFDFGQSSDASPPTLSGVDVDQIWRSIVGMVPLPGLSMLQRIRVIHAVEKPLFAPSFQREGDLPGTRLPFKIIRLPSDTAIVQPPSDGQNAWQTIAATPGKDLSTEPSQPRGTIGFIAGQIALDRASTGEVRCEARWSNAGETDSVIQDVNGSWSRNPKVRQASPMLFQIPQLPRDPGQDTTKNGMCLTYDEFGKLRSLNYTFSDTKARKLALRLVAKSRFAEYFTKNGSSDDQFELASGPAVGPSQGPNLGLNEFWLRSTEQPKKPSVSKVIWLLPEEVVRRDAARIIMTKRVIVRIYLDRYWFDSGDGELLGLICWPPDLVDEKIEPANMTEQTGHRLDPGEALRAAALRRRTLCDLTSCTAFVSQFVTRWGVDPTNVSADLPAMIGPEHFGGYCRKVPNLLLPPPETKPQSPKAATAGGPLSPGVAEPVAIIAYEPKFDAVEGLWYCDIDFDPGPAHGPFVRFGLARYQPNAIIGKELSAPLPLDALQIPPRRTVDITIEKQRTVLAKVMGLAYSRRNLDYAGYPDTENARVFQNLTDVPLQRFSIKRTSSSGAPQHSAGPVSVFGADGKALEMKFIQPSESNGQFQWSYSFDLPELIEPGKYSLMIEEVDLFTSDSDTRPAAADPTIGHLVPVPSKFSCTVNL